ncbi:exo-alpha-sialidase [Flavobacteriaceae bacterium GSB9]|nr:exo-alpha-sialidase [Flavobacteriaceae bacterium GSB9]
MITKRFLLVQMLLITLIFGCKENEKTESRTQVKIAGKVVNALGKPISEAVIKLKATGETAKTNENGKFVLSGNVPKGSGQSNIDLPKFIDTISVEKPGFLNYQKVITNPEISEMIIVPAASDLPAVQEDYIFESSPHFRSCHASTILELDNGDLLCSFFAGTKEAYPDVEIWMSRKSTGKQWTAPLSVADGVQSDSVRVGTGNPILFKPLGEDLTLFYKVLGPGDPWKGWYKTSSDLGKTWGKPQELPDLMIGPDKNKPVQLASGTILAPSAVEDSNGWRVHVLRSTDNGKTWDKMGPINPEAKIGAIQPTLLTYTDGRIQMLCRTRSEHGFMAQSWSDDDGLTWSPLEALVLPNNNSGADGVTLRDGRQLLVYNHSTRTQEGMGHKGRGILNVALSRDGIHWEAALILEYLDESGKQFSYPSVIQTNDGLVHILYTWHRRRIKHVVINPERLKPVPMPEGKWPTDGPVSLEVFKKTKTNDEQL